ncbi:MAG: phosphodiester glycosidase family protein [Eggerthellaceae bacterium]|nr:phosphodiester glycosidase family protein [Eggerthellaceae bacterium]
MAKSNRKRHTRLSSDTWVYVASALLTVFTVFVLLDTFAIARVQQVAQAADYSSIVAAQENAQRESTEEAAASESVGANAAESAADSGESHNGTSSSDSSSSSEEESTASSSSTQSRGHHGPHGGSSSGENGASSGSTSSSKGKGGSSESTSSTNSAVGASQVVAGAASAATSGTQIGSYSDENMQITVSKLRAYDTDIYVADVQVTSAEYLKTALAQGSYGRNLKDTTSNIAESVDAVLAVNGDYYGFRDEGYVLRNGVLYRDTAASDTDALVISGDGTMTATSQDETTAQQLKESGAWQVLSFGPALVNDSQIVVDANEDVSRSMGSNPRTAIGMVSPLHYVVVVSDGRTDENAGLSLYELAQVLIDNGATFAYNLDGGGSTTMYFQGEVINNPTSGNRDGERSVSDIVYFG